MYVQTQWSTTKGLDNQRILAKLPPALRGERVVPFTCGPGHRSHRCAAEGVMRKTHGPNEGFDKATGRACLPFFVGLVGQFAARGEASGAGGGGEGSISCGVVE